MPLGIVPDAGALQRLPRLIPKKIATVEPDIPGRSSAKPTQKPARTNFILSFIV